MSNIDNILDKTQYGIDDNFVDMYKNLAFHQASEQEFHIFSEDYIPFYFIAGLSSVFAFLLMSYGTHILYSFFLAGATFIIFITSWLHLNQDAISNCFNLANSKERVEKFENKWIFNEKNFLSIL